MVVNLINRITNNGVPTPLKAFVQRNLTNENKQPVKNNLVVRDRPLLPVSRKDNKRVQFIDPSAAIKSDLWSRNALEFINAANSNVNVPYSEQQLLQAYMTSVYMFSALRRVANLISRVKIVAEIKDGQRYVRAPETARINQIFYKEGGQLLSRVWLNYAVYGSSVIYKVKSRRAILEEQDGRPIYDYKDGAVAGLRVLDKPLWDLDEDVAHGELKGLFVNQYDAAEKILENRNYLYRQEFVYSTDWNPENPNRGRSIVAVAIHEAVANAAIAQWMSEYFTRGAMPFIMVALAEDDPAVMTDSDLQQYRRQIEEYSQGIGSSLRSVFFDRRVSVEQVGISADEVAAPELNTTALEGISAAVGLDRELIVTPEGGSQERHDALIKRAWDDTVIPLAKKFLEDMNRDLGLPENMRLVLDLSEISELDADREEKASTEISVYESGLETYNEARTRLKMPPVKELDGWLYFDGKPMPINNILEASGIPSQTVLDFAMLLWDGNLAKRSQVLEILGKKLGENERDGYKVDIEESFSFIQGLWGDDLLTRKQVLNFMGYELPQGAEDGYRSELERGADYGEFITGLWSDNLLTRSQTIKLLDMGVELPPNIPDGFANDISEFRSSVMDMWSNNLMTRQQAMDKLGIASPSKNAMFIDDYSSVVDSIVSRESSRIENENSNIKDWWDANLITREEAMRRLEIPLPKDSISGFKQEIEVIEAGLAEKELADMTKEEGGDDNGGGGGGGSNWRSIMPPPKSPTPSSPLIYNNEELYDFDTNRQDEISHSIQSDEAILTDDAMAGAEEDLLRGFGEYTFDPLESYYDEDVDIYPEESLPVSETYVDVFDNPNTEEDDWLYEEASSQGRYPYNEKNPDEETESYRTSKDMVGRMSAELDSNIDETSINQLELKAFENTYTDIYKFANNNNDEKMLNDFIDENISLEDASFELPQEILEDMIQSVYFNREEMEEAPQDETAENELYACAWIGENKNILTLQDKLKELMGDDPDINWQDPTTFHVTLVYSQDVSDKQVENITAILPKELQYFKLEVNGIGLFENEKETVVYLKLKTNDTLSDIQAKLFSAFSACALEVSNYSVPGEFNPHITLAYLPAGSNVPNMSFDTFDVQVSNIFLGRDNYEMVKEIPLVNKVIKFELNSERNDYVPLEDAEFSVEKENNSSVSYQDENKENLKPSYENYESEFTPQELMLDSEISQLEENWKQTLRNNYASRIEKMLLGKEIEESFEGLPEIIQNAIAEYSNKSEDGIEMLKSIKLAVEAGAFDNNELNQRVFKSFVNIKAKQDDVSQELKAWERATVRSGVKKGLKFEVLHVPENVSKEIKEELGNANPLDNGEIKAVFAKARKALGIE